jgi:hypothetical protein
MTSAHWRKCWRGVTVRSDVCGFDLKSHEPVDARTARAAQARNQSQRTSNASSHLPTDYEHQAIPRLHESVRAWLNKHPRFQLHFTPTSSLWLNLVERWFRELTDKALRRGVFHSVPDLIAKIENNLTAHNNDPKPSYGPPAPKTSSPKSPADASRSRRSANDETGTSCESRRARRTQPGRPHGRRCASAPTIVWCAPAGSRPRAGRSSPPQPRVRARCSSQPR